MESILIGVSKKKFKKLKILKFEKIEKFNFLEFLESCRNPRKYCEEFYKIYKFQDTKKFPNFETYMGYIDAYNSVASLKIPTLLISAKNDPMSHIDFIPWEHIESNENIIYAYTPHGGHLDFMVGPHRDRWFPPVVKKFFSALDSFEASEQPDVVDHGSGVPGSGQNGPNRSSF